MLGPAASRVSRGELVQWFPHDPLVQKEVAKAQPCVVNSRYLVDRGDHVGPCQEGDAIDDLRPGERDDGGRRLEQGGVLLVDLETDEPEAERFRTSRQP
jgi:hypothetical protein